MSFNLSTDPWVPVLIGTRRSVLSLTDVFSQADKITGISGDPVERFSIMRMLICITQAAIDGPADEAAWKKCKKDISTAAQKYLKKWKVRFDLYGDHPFLQVSALQRMHNHTKAFLNSFIASGGNHTLFDSEARLDTERSISEEDIAKAILITQVFGDCGLRSRAPNGTAWGGSKVALYGKSAIPTNNLLTLVEGDSLLDTIYYNLINKDWLEEAKIPFGRPLWETSVPEQEGKVAKDIVRTYLYNLVPMSRGILLEKDTNEMSYSDGICPCALPQSAKGSEFSYRDPMATIIAKRQAGKKPPIDDYLKLNPEKSPWRDLQSILQISQTTQVRKGPWALRHLIGNTEGEIRIATGGFAYNKAKPVMTCEWRVALPADFLDNSTIDEYQVLVNKAEETSRSVAYALEIHLKLAEKNLSFEDKKNRKVYQALLSSAMKRYWHGLEACADRLLTTLPEDPQRAREEWGRDILQHAVQAFEEACSGYAKKDLGSYVKALNFLHRRIRNGNSNGASKVSGAATPGAAEEQSGDVVPEEEPIADASA